MRASDCIRCDRFPCPDVKHDCFLAPDIIVKPEAISMIMISEASPDNASDYYYAKNNPLFERTTLQAFHDAGFEAASVGELVKRGVYLTTAVKCAKTVYGIRPGTIRECSHLLEKELSLFPNVKVLMLMGDVAIKALNFIARRLGEKRPIPSGSTYRIRSGRYFFRGCRVFPSYLQAGPSFFIEKSKRRMIAEDIRSAVAAAK